jgi:hypothetical protein
MRSGEWTLAHVVKDDLAVVGAKDLLQISRQPCVRVGAQDFAGFLGIGDIETLLPNPGTE